MSQFRGEYCTLEQLRQSGEGASLNIESNAADAFLLALIREVSADIDALAGRKFVPAVTTQYYDAPVSSAWTITTRLGGMVEGRSLFIDTDDLLEVTTLTNGDGTLIAAANFLLYPPNAWPKNEVRLKVSGGISWLPSSAGDTEQVIALAGIFGYHEDYTGSAWGGCGTVTDGAGINAAVTTFTASALAGIEPGMLLKIDSEFLYASQVSGTTVTIERGVNGSTAAAHLTAAPVSYWQPIFTVGRIARMAATAYWNLRANPEGKQVSVNGVTFTTPNSVAKWIGQELDQTGLTKTVTG